MLDPTKDHPSNLVSVQALFVVVGPGSLGEYFEQALECVEQTSDPLDPEDQNPAQTLECLRYSLSLLYLTLVFEVSHAGFSWELLYFSYPFLVLALESVGCGSLAQLQE